MQPPTARPDSETSRDADSSRDRRLILVGASVRAAAQSACRAGFEVIGIDRYGDTDTLAHCDRHISLHQPASAVRLELAPFAGTPVIQAGGLGNLGHAVDDLLSNCRRLGPSTEQTAELREPSFLRELANHCGANFPTTTDSTGTESATGWLRKQKHSCGGLGVQWSASKAVADRTVVYQRWIAGRNLGATYLSNGRGAVLLGVCRSLTTRVRPHPFVYAGSYGPVDLGSKVSESLSRLGNEIVARSGLRGLFNVDVIVDRSDAVWLLEINPRWSASCEVVERALISRGRLDPNDSLIGLGHNAMRNTRLPPLHGDLENNTCARTRFLKRIVFARKSGHYRWIKWESLRIERCDVPHEGTPIRRGEPIVTLIARVDENDRRIWRDVAEACRQCRAAVQ